MKKWIVVLFAMLLPATALADGWVYAGTNEIKVGAKFSSDTGNVVRDAPSPKGAEVARTRAGQSVKALEVTESYGHFWIKVETTKK